MANENINRIKVMLAEKNKSNKWLAEQLGKDQGTISQWCTNTCQPDLKNLMSIAYKIIIAFLIFICPYSASAIIPDTTYIRKPEQMGLMYKDLSVVTQDGYKIATWFFPAQDAISDAEFANLNGERRPYVYSKDKPSTTLIICNGDAGNMSYFQLQLAMTLTSLGFNVVTFDWRGFGESSRFEMDYNYLCYKQMLDDYDAVIDKVVSLSEVDKDAITVMGWSTGAYLSMITAYTNKNISAFVGRSLCTDFDDFIPLVMEKKNKTRDQLIVPADFPKDLMPIKIASEFTKPIFLIVGENDFRTPVWMSKKVLDLIPESVPKELIIVKNAAHGGKEDPIIVDYENFISRVSAFLVQINS